MRAKNIAITLIFLFTLIPIGKISSAAQTEQKIPVLLYHHVLDSSENILYRDHSLVVDTEVFLEQMRYLYDNGYNTITPDDLQNFLYNGEQLPEKSVFIHFDDGYYSNIIRAYPILQEFGFKATIFSITVSAMPPQAPFRPDITNMSISHESMEATSDVFTYASHTHDMHRLVADSDYTRFLIAPESSIIEDLNTSFQIVDNSTAFAYPLGQYNESRIDALREAGVDMAFTVNSGYVTHDSDPFRLDRFIVYRNTSMDIFQRYVSGEMSFPRDSNTGYIQLSSDEIAALLPYLDDTYEGGEIPAGERPSEWAEREVAFAISLGLAPESLQVDYTEDITREEFAMTAIHYLSAISNINVVQFLDTYRELFASSDNFRISDGDPFTDTSDVFTVAAYELGVVNGRGDGIFDPYSSITRQDASVMLLNTLIVVTSYDQRDDFESTLEVFVDIGDIADWAFESSAVMYRLGVLVGVGDDRFDPLGHYTREQCFASFVRLYMTGS